MQPQGSESPRHHDSPLEAAAAMGRERLDKVGLSIHGIANSLRMLGVIDAQGNVVRASEQPNPARPQTSPNLGNTIVSQTAEFNPALVSSAPQANETSVSPAEYAAQQTGGKQVAQTGPEIQSAVDDTARNLELEQKWQQVMEAYNMSDAEDPRAQQ